MKEEPEEGRIWSEDSENELIGEELSMNDKNLQSSPSNSYRVTDRQAARMATSQRRRGGEMNRGRLVG